MQKLKTSNQLIITFSYFSFQFKLQLSHDGSGKGAALVAAVAMRLRDQKKDLMTSWFELIRKTTELLKPRHVSVIIHSKMGQATHKRDSGD